MQKNDRVQSQFNTGTIRRITDETVTVHWDGFISPIDLPRGLVETYPIVGSDHDHDGTDDERTAEEIEREERERKYERPEGWGTVEV